jgi:hypothetical protein
MGRLEIVLSHTIKKRKITADRDKIEPKEDSRFQEKKVSG